MTPLTEVVEGWTGALPFTLKADDVAIDLTGMTLSIVLKDAKGTVIKDSDVGVTVIESTAGTLEYEPSSSEFVAARSPYKVRFRVVDTGSKVVYHPNGDEDLITVKPV